MEATIKNLSLLKTIEAKTVKIDLLSSSPQIIWYLTKMVIRYSLNGHSDIVKSGKVSVPGDVIRVFKVIPDDIDIKIWTTTRRLIITHESATYKIKYIKHHTGEADIPECSEEDGRVAILSSEDFLNSLRALPDDAGDKIILSFYETFAEFLMFDTRIHAKITANCQSTGTFSYCIDKKTIQVLKILLGDIEGDIWVSGNDNIIRITSSRWISEIVAIEYTAKAWEGNRFFDLRIEADLNKLLRFFRILNICKTPCGILFDVDRIIGEATSETLIERVEIPASIYGTSLGKGLTVDAEAFIFALEGCKKISKDVAIEFADSSLVKVSCIYCDFLIFPISENYCQLTHKEKN
jgi:hypothetical protein